jgi:dipeptidyl aminopeptidase/acylaminoacyl peptidase
MRLYAAAFAGLLVACSVKAQPMPAPDMAAAFGALPDIRDVALSPDGKMASYLSPTREGGTALVIASIDAGGAKAVFADSPATSVRLCGCQWGSPDRLICSLSSEGKVGRGMMTFERLIAVAPDGSGVRALGRTQTGEVIGGFSTGDGEVIDKLVDTPGQVLLADHVFEEDSRNTRIARTKSGLHVVRLDLKTGRRTEIEAPVEDGIVFMTDGHGQIRLRGIRPYLPAVGGPGGTWLQRGVRIDYSYRAAPGAAWRPLVSATVGNGQDSFEPLAVDGDWLYARKPVGGRMALVKHALDGSDRETVVLARPDVDVDGVIRSGKYGRVVGATFATDRRRIEWFDPAMAQLAAQLGGALPGKPLVYIRDESWDGNRMVIFAGSDRDPGRYYLLDRPTHKLTVITEVRPRLEGMTLAEVRTVAVRARDGTMVPAYLTLPPGRPAKNLPTLVMPHGGPAARDEWGFDWWPQFYAQLGYAVIQPNYRGSAGYGQEWYRRNGFKDWAAAMADVNDAAHWLVSQGIADPSRLGIIGWSYGGYAALQANVIEPKLYKAAVAVAPVTDLALLRDQQNPVSSGYSAERAYIGTGEHLTQGSPARRAAEIAVPVLLFEGERDIAVDPAQARAMQAALTRAGKTVELKTYPGLGHSLESGDARADMLRRSAKFLESAMGQVSPAVTSSATK